MTNPTTPPDAPQNNGKKWLKRIGAAGFLFFLIKGLLWLVLFGLVAFGLADASWVEKVKGWLP